MAESITLRAYLDELNRLLDRESLAEVISHCRYVLQHYPQNVETYRILAKALLQKGNNEGLDEHFTEAAEVFRRVLSVVPNDYVAHLGMSEIREHDNALDEAIWHLERAYEQLPGNQMLQQALRALYVKRDGEQRAPEKIQLTRAALARQYINGQLHDQALIELRTGLQQSPDRLDLQVLLAETLWEGQHPVEAAEAAIQILKKLPYCLPANRIMAQLWLDYERPSDAQVFLDRIEAVDPYAAANIVRPDSDAPDPVTITRLDYGTRAQVSLTSETPEWVQELGDLTDGWNVADLYQMSPSEQAPSAQPERQDILEDSPDLFGVWASPGEPAAADIPDWFSEIGAGPDTPEPAGADWTTPETPVGAAQPSSQAPLPADIPDWFADVVGEQPAAAPPDQSPAPMDWLLEEEAEAPPAAVAADWLLEENPPEGEPPSFEDLVGAPLGSAPASPREALDLSADLFDFDSLEIETPAASPSSGFTDLLAGIEAAQEPGDVAPAASEAEPLPPEWLGAFGEEPRAEPSASEPAEVAWEDLLGQPEATRAEDDVAFLASFDEPLVETPRAAGDSTELVEEWSSLDQDQFMQELFTANNSPSGSLPPEDILGEVATPEWLPSAGSTSEPEEQPGSDSVSWLGALDEAADAWDAQLPLEPVETAPQVESPAGVSETVEDDDWLTSAGTLRDSGLLHALEEAQELTLSTEEPEEPIELASELPDWVRSAAPVPPESPEPAAEVPGPLPVGEDLMALFETADSSTPWDQMPASESQVEQELDWLRPPATEEDWLSSFAKEESEPDEEPLEEIDLAARLGTVLETPAPAADEWLGEGEEFQLEAVQEEPTLTAQAEIVYEELPSEPAEAPSEESVEAAESPAAEESTEESPRWGASKLLSSLGAQAQAQDSPAWLADMEPVPSASEAAAGALDQPYDPFEGGSPDNVPQYSSARDTGILQPDETPAWMGAFTGEDVPDESHEAPEAILSQMEPALEPADRDTLPYDGETELDLFGGDPAEADRLPELAPDDYTDEVSDEAFAAEEGGVPDWLSAITGSETAKFPDLAFDEPGSYSAAQEDEGVLQPDSETDWLSGVQPSADLGRMLSEEEDLDFPAEEDVLFGLKLPQDDEMMADLQALRDAEVARAGDLTHTSQFEMSDQFADDEDDDSVPDDFSFGGWQPLWLRETNGDSAYDAGQEGAIPDWLLNSFDDDENR